MVHAKHTPPRPTRITVSPRQIVVALPSGSVGIVASDATQPRALAHAVGAVHVREFHTGRTNWQHDPDPRRYGRRYRFDLFPAATTAPDWGDDEGDLDVCARFSQFAEVLQ